MPEEMQLSKVSIRQLRDAAIALKDANDPEMDSDAQNEARTKALANLFIILCDRVIDLGLETGEWFQRLDTQDKECMQVIQEMAGKAAPAAPADPASMSAETIAAAEVSALPPTMKSVPTKVENGSTPSDPAAIAANMNKTATIPPIQVIK